MNCSAYRANCVHILITIVVIVTILSSSTLRKEDYKSTRCMKRRYSSAEIEQKLSHKKILENDEVKVRLCIVVRAAFLGVHLAATRTLASRSRGAPHTVTRREFFHALLRDEARV